MACFIDQLFIFNTSSLTNSVLTIARTRGSGENSTWSNIKLGLVASNHRASVVCAAVFSTFDRHLARAGIFGQLSFVFCGDLIYYRRCSLSDTLSVRHSRFVSSALKLWIWAFQDFPAFFWFASRGSVWQVLCRYLNAIFPLFNLAQHTSCGL